MDSMFDAIYSACASGVANGYLPESFKYSFVINSIICSFLIGPLLGGIGTMVVIKRLAFFSEAIGHAALTGVAIGIMVGEPYTSPYVSLFGFCIIFGLAMNYTKNRSRMSTDTLIGVYLSISIAVGACLLLYVASKVNMHVVDSVLFGSILTVSSVDIIILLVITVICAVLALTRFNRILLGSFNPSLARVKKVRVVFLDYLFVFMITVITVASVKIIGAVLVEALLLIPAAAAKNVCRGVTAYFFISIIISSVSCLLGVVVPMEIGLPVPSGGAVIMVAALFFFLSYSVKPCIRLIKKVRAGE